MAEVQVALSSEQFKKFIKLQKLPFKQALSVSDCSDLLSLSEKTVREMINRNELPSFHVGGRVLVSRSGLLEWIEGKAKSEGG